MVLPKVFFMVYVGSQIGGVIGPVPYDMNECLFRASVKQEELQAQIDTGTDLHGNELDPMVYDITFTCEEHYARPPVTYSE